MATNGNTHIHSKPARRSGRGFFDTHDRADNHSTPLKSALGHEDDAVARFFAFVAERAEIERRRARGEPRPWTQDEILDRKHFCNVRRLLDFTSKWVRHNWYDPHWDDPRGEILFNCALFRYTGTIEFAEAIGWQRTWDPDRIITIAERRIAQGEKVFTRAYRIRPDNTREGVPTIITVCEKYLRPLWDRADEIAATARRTHSWRRTHECLSEVPGFGGSGFMAMQVLLDARWTPILEDCRDINEWCPAGPGAVRGINRVLDRPVDAPLSQSDALEAMLVLFDDKSHFLPPYLSGGLFSEGLELPDIEFCLCEFDKYERCRLGEGSLRNYVPHPRTGARTLF